MRTQRVLVIGGGITGMCTAIELRKRGHHVDLVEIDPDWSVYGAGITLSGPTLRAFAEIGVIDDILATGWCADGVDIHAADGQRLTELPTPRVGRPDVPGGGGILRPELARILREHTLKAHAKVRCATSFESIQQDGDRVNVCFTDGNFDSYDLVVGADGLQSRVRQRLFEGAPMPRYSGQASWRAVVPRPESITRAAMFMGPTIKAGVNPVSQDEMYLFVTEPRPQANRLLDAELPGLLAKLLAPFGGAIADIREGLGAHSRIVYRPFYTLLMPPAWNRGRVVLVGDAVHATTPHLASGAGIGVEDALVLAQELDKAADVPSALAAFGKRRFERCRAVVENSVRLGEMEHDGSPKEDHAALMRSTMAALLAPI